QAAARPAAAGGASAWIGLAMDEDPALSVSLHVFRRRPWPATLAPVEVDRALATAIDLPAAVRLPAQGLEPAEREDHARRGRGALEISSPRGRERLLEAAQAFVRLFDGEIHRRTEANRMGARGETEHVVLVQHLHRLVARLGVGQVERQEHAAAAG